MVNLYTASRLVLFQKSPFFQRTFLFFRFSLLISRHLVASPFRVFFRAFFFPASPHNPGIKKPSSVEANSLSVVPPFRLLLLLLLLLLFLRFSIESDLEPTLCWSAGSQAVTSSCICVTPRRKSRRQQRDSKLLCIANLAYVNLSTSDHTWDREL